MSEPIIPQPFFVPTNPEMTHLDVFLFEPGMPLELRRIENTLQAMEELLGSPLTLFEIGVEGIIGLAMPDNIGRAQGALHDTAAGMTQVQNRLINRTFPKADVFLFGVFLLFKCGAPSNFETSSIGDSHTLATWPQGDDNERVLDALDPELALWDEACISYRGATFKNYGTGSWIEYIFPLPSTKEPVDPLAPPCPTIQVLVFPPGALPEVRSLRFCVEEMQVMVEVSDLTRNKVKSFYTGVHGTTGFGNLNAMNSLHHSGDRRERSESEFLELQRNLRHQGQQQSYEEYLAGIHAWSEARGPLRPVNRIVPLTGEEIRGLFFVACYSFRSRSLSPPQLDRLLSQFAPELTPEQSTNIMLSLEGGEDWLKSRP